LDDILRAEGTSNPTVMIIGPGAVTRLASPFLNDAAALRTGAFRKLVGDAARYGDQLLRRVPFMPLTSLEPRELEASLSMPHRLVVVDCSLRILKSICASLPSAECHCVDLALSAPPLTADVVIAFNVVCRLHDPAKGMRHVAQAVRPGGWLLIDDRSANSYRSGLSDFEAVASKIHRRASSSSI
jgi:SAM-dependent methyltransferase